jgi:RecB family exonuclease
MAEGGDSATTCLDSWPKNLVPYGQAIAQFHAIYRPEFHHTEERITDEPLHLTGCPDRVGVVKGYRTVVDYKTGGEYAWHRLQLALYAILLDRINQPTDIRMAVYLSKEGECRTVIHKANKDILEAWSLIKEYGEAINGQSKQKKTSTHDS